MDFPIRKYRNAQTFPFLLVRSRVNDVIDDPSLIDAISHAEQNQDGYRAIEALEIAAHNKNSKTKAAIKAIAEDAVCFYKLQLKANSIDWVSLSIDSLYVELAMCEIKYNGWLSFLKEVQRIKNKPKTNKKFLQMRDSLSIIRRELGK